MNLLSKTMLPAAVATVAVSAATFTATAPAQALSLTYGTPENFGFGPALTANGQATSVITFPSAGIVPTAVTELSTTNTTANGRAFIQNQNTGNARLNNFYGSLGGFLGLTNGFNVGEAFTPLFPGTANRSVKLTFDKPLGYFGFLWAAPEANDILTFNFLNGGSFDYNPTTAGIPTGLLTATYVNFFATAPSDIIESIVFSQSGPGGFNVRNVAYQAIPTPALLPGLLAMGVGVLRKRKAEQASEA